MTIQDYIERNLPFYHITPMSKLPSILKEGLKSIRRKPICVVRNCREPIINEICRQIDTEGENNFAIIKIQPKEKGINADMISEDSVDEPTAPLHNYIHVKMIKVSKNDVVKENYKPDPNVYEISEEDIIRLTGYMRTPYPILNSDLTEE